MIKLPYTYKDYYNNDYEIIGWKGHCLVTKHSGRTFVLTRHDTVELLQSLGLKESDIPGHPVPIPTPPYRGRLVFEEGD